MLLQFAPGLSLNRAERIGSLWFPQHHSQHTHRDQLTGLRLYPAQHQRDSLLPSLYLTRSISTSLLCGATSYTQWSLQIPSNSSYSTILRKAVILLYCDVKIILKNIHETSPSNSFQSYNPLQLHQLFLSIRTRERTYEQENGNERDQKS